MVIVHLHSELNGGSDTGHSPLLLYQVSRSSRTLDSAPTTLLPPRYLESTKAVLHVTRAASMNSMQCKLEAGGLPYIIPYNTNNSPFFDQGVGRSTTLLSTMSGAPAPETDTSGWRYQFPTAPPERL